MASASIDWRSHVVPQGSDRRASSRPGRSAKYRPTRLAPVAALAVGRDVDGQPEHRSSRQVRRHAVGQERRALARHPRPQCLSRGERDDRRGRRGPIAGLKRPSANRAGVRQPGVEVDGTFRLREAICGRNGQEQGPAPRPPCGGAGPRPIGAHRRVARAHPPTAPAARCREASGSGRSRSRRTR